MCYDTNARPPHPPGQPGTGNGEDIELVAADGTHFAAFRACAGEPNGAQVLIYPDVRGLHGFYKDLAMRFAEQGVDALAIDYFGRTASDQPRDDSFEYMPHVEQMTAKGFFADVGAALADMRRGEGASHPTFTLGFCMGGALSLITGTRDLGLAGVIGFYPGLSRMRVGGLKPAIEQGQDIRCPVLCLFGGADQGIPESDVNRLDQEMNQAGVKHEFFVYAGAPHSFFDRKQDEFAEASTDAWQRVLSFIAAHNTTK